MIRPLTRRERDILIICLTTVVLYGFSDRVLRPMQEEANFTDQQTAARQLQLREMTGAIEAAGKVDGKYRAYAHQFGQTVTDEEASIIILSEIETVAKDAGLLVTGLKPGKIQQAELGNLFSISLVGEGELTDIARFLYMLQRLPYAFRVAEAELIVLEMKQEQVIGLRCLLSKMLIPNSGRASAMVDDDSEKTRGLDGMPFASEPFEVHARAIQRRDFFRPPWEEKPTVPVVVRKELPELEKRIRLIGILLDADPKVIIEDLQEREVRFLSKGDGVGPALLQEVRHGQAIFSFRDEWVEMEL